MKTPVTEAVFALMELGVTGEALRAALERIETAAYDGKFTLEEAVEIATAREDIHHVSKGAERTRRYRARKASQDASLASQNVTEASQASPRDDGSKAKGFPHPSKNPTSDSPPKVPPSPPKTALAEQIWQMQPELKGKRRSTRPDVLTALDGVLRRGADPAQVEAACRAFYALPDSRKEGGEYAMGAARLLQRDRWREFLPTPRRIDPKASEAAFRNRIERWIELSEWSPEWGPPPNAPGCTVPPALLAEYQIGKAA
jgi:hypothetical protein